ncbi:MAG: TIM barrel protein [Gemmataceae bacterium]|nr:TIM barrel protein [Gemmata sp.]MDW8197551.1 TIM barrel protein [Gemmataceae bacterium]
MLSQPQMMQSQMMQTQNQRQPNDLCEERFPLLSRRHMIQTGLGLTALTASQTRGLAVNHSADKSPEPLLDRRGRIQQSVAFWCFHARGEKWSAEKVCQVAKDLKCVSVELIPPEHWPLLKKYGLICAIASNGVAGAAFKRGLNNRRFHEEVIAQTKKTIDQCAEAKFPNVIAFVGYRWIDPDNPRSGEITRDDAFRNCVNGLKQLAQHAEKQGVTVCLEHLNTRDDSDPMKGHPGYQGDDLDFVASIIRNVGSPRVQLLFDIYHVQIMHGDLLRRIEQNKDILGHIHTAGVPGRGELDEHQEINYPAVMKKLRAIGYTGYVGQEFIPTRDPLAGLKHAVTICDVA